MRSMASPFRPATSSYAELRVGSILGGRSAPAGLPARARLTEVREGGAALARAVPDGRYAKAERVRCARKGQKSSPRADRQGIPRNAARRRRLPPGRGPRRVPPDLAQHDWHVAAAQGVADTAWRSSQLASLAGRIVTSGVVAAPARSRVDPGQRRPIECQACGMDSRPTDLASLVGAWRLALASAQGALQAAARDLPPSELRLRSTRLAEERNATVRLLEALAGDRGEERLLVRLVGSTWDARRLLGLPAEVCMCLQRRRCARPERHHACGGVAGDLRRAALEHDRPDRSSFAPFSVQADYDLYVHGRTRHDAIREFLASRGVSLPEGSADEGPGVGTVNALARYKSSAPSPPGRAREGVPGGAPFPRAGARGGYPLCRRLAAPAQPTCSSGPACRTWSTKAWMDDGARGGAASEAVPDMLLAAGRRLGVPPEDTAVFETSADGVVAGRAGGFDLVVAVDHGGQANALPVSGRGPGGVGPRRDPRAIARRATPRRTRLFEVTFRARVGGNAPRHAGHAGSTARPDRARSGARALHERQVRRPRSGRARFRANSSACSHVTHSSTSSV